MRQPEYEDGEVVGVDADGSIVQWDAVAHQAYNSGETPEEFGLNLLSEAELLRVIDVRAA